MNDWKNVQIQGRNKHNKQLCEPSDSLDQPDRIASLEDELDSVIINKAPQPLHKSMMLLTPRRNG